MSSSTVASSPKRQRSRLPSVPRFLNPIFTSSASSKDRDGNEEDDEDTALDDNLQSQREVATERDEPIISSTLTGRLSSQLSALVSGVQRRYSGSPDPPDLLHREVEGDAVDVEAAQMAPQYCTLLSPSLEDPSAPPIPVVAEMPGLERTMSVLSTGTLSQMMEGPQELPHVPLSYRVPTAKMAFYDTHMGSSSGWTSLKGKADTVLRPFGVGGTVDPRRKSADKGSSSIGKRDDRGITPNRSDQDPVQQQSRMQDKQSQDHLAPAQDTLPAGVKQHKTGWSSFLSTDTLLPTSLTSISIFGSPSTTPVTQSQQLASDLDVVPVIGPRHPRASEFFNDVKGHNVVILGGYRGSVLRDAKTRHMVWIPLKVGTGLRRPTLELGLSPSAEDNAAHLVEADVTLSRIGKMVDMSSRLQSKLARKGAVVYPWGYDWRLSLGKSSERLRSFLQELFEASSSVPSERRGAIVIAHSMGGLVALHALSQASDPRIFQTLSFGSSPFLGTPNILGPLAYGDAALYNTTICSPRSTFSWRSTFYLLPRDKQCFETESGERKEVDFLNIKTWEWAGFSPVVRSTRRWQDLQRVSSEPEQASATADDEVRFSFDLDGERNRRKEAESADNADTMEVPGAAPIDGPSLGKPPPPNRDAANATSFSVGMASRALEGGTMAAQRAVETDHSLNEVASSETLEPPEALVGADRQQPSNGENEEANKSSGPSKSDEDEIWNYLRRTLHEVSKFDAEILSGFDERKLAEGLYPPITMLTSGRTPTTRGALVADGTSASDAAATTGTSASDGTGDGRPPADWRGSVRASDYSRMLYGKGDGVVTLRSSTHLPGEWKKCLVKNDQEATAGAGGAGQSLAWITESSHRHVSLFSDVDGIGRAIWIAMRQKERTRRGLQD